MMAAKLLLVSFLFLATGCVPATATPTVQPTKPAPATAPAKATVPATPAQKPAAATPASSGKSQQPLTKFTLARPGGVIGGGFMTALGRGYWTELGIDVDLVDYDSAARMIPAMATGQLDAGIGSPSASLFNAIVREVPVRIVSDISSSPPGYGTGGLVVRKDLWDSGQFRDYPDLKGRTYAVNAFQTGSHYQAYLAAKLGGLKLEDINLVELPFPEALAALGNKSIDVARLVEPLMSAGEAQGIAKIWKYSSEIDPGQQDAILLFSPQLMREKNELAKRWMVGYLRGARAFNDALEKGIDKEEIVGHMMKYSTVKDRAVFEKLFRQKVDPNGYINKQSLTGMLNWFIEMNMVKPMTLDEAMDMQFVDYAVQQLGEYK